MVLSRFCAHGSWKDIVTTFKDVFSKNVKSIPSWQIRSYLDWKKEDC